MRITICSDIHDNIWKLEVALPGMNDGDILLFCGDFCAPFTLDQLARGFSGPIHTVLGNNDGDSYRLSQIAARAGNVTQHGELALLDLDGYRVAINHYPAIAADLAASGRYQLVCTGHDHTQHIEKVGDTWLINPGELMGRFGTSIYVVFDTTTEEVEVRRV